MGMNKKGKNYTPGVYVQEFTEMINKINLERLLCGKNPLQKVKIQRIIAKKLKNNEALRLDEFVKFA